jgi:ubiquinone/menaquinone biosynthesis C-methylase UbiE
MADTERLLSPAEARTTYDRIGSWVDLQALFEDQATADLAVHLDATHARVVLEFGCGTGRFAEHMLADCLPPDARYVAVDISPKMHSLATGRLARFGDRVATHLADGRLPLPFDDGSFDRFVSNYVFDLLSVADIEAVLNEAHRLLRRGGLLGVVGLTSGFTVASKAFERLWMALHAIRPALVGGCRPIALVPLLSPNGWRVRHQHRLSRFGIASEIVVAERI